MNIPKEHPEGVDVIEYNYIDDGIFIGTNQCCQIHFDEELLKKGVTQDVSLEGENVDSPYRIETYLWIPVVDHAPPSPDQMEIGVSSLRNLINLNKKVYVHCKRGHGRAPTLVAAYFIKEKGLTPTEAVSFIKERRPVIHLQDSQIKALEDFYTKVG